jgi:PAS domain S-box-containing protein
MLRFKSKFESEVHLGFLVIVSLLLLLNLMTNFMVYKARSTSGEQLTYDFRRAGLTVSRAVHQARPDPMGENERNRILAQYDLGSMLLVPSRPADLSPQARRKWFTEVAANFPASELPEIAEKLLLADFEQLTRGRGDEYFYVYPLGAGENGMVILSMKRPDLAYLDDSRRLLTYLLPGTLTVIILVYLTLSRKIFYPFRKIKQQAELVGRSVGPDENEAEAVAEEYRQVIERLRQKEAELLRLNASIQRKADKLEQLNRYLLRSTHSGILTLDTFGLILDCNESARRMLMLDDRRYVGAHFQDLFEGYPEMVKRISKTLEQGHSESYREIVITRSDQTELVLGLSISPISDHSGKVVGMSVVLNDSTELNRLKRELEQSTRMSALGEMAGGLAHQLRNSIGAIRGFGDLVRKRLTGNNLPANNLDALLEETRQAEELISLFLNFARPFDLNCVRIHLEPFVRELVRTFEVRPEYASARFSLEFEGTPTIEADPTLLKQALSNIVDNAILAYPNRDGSIDITAKETTGGVLLDVTDFGSGIPENDIERVFTPFFSSRPSGSGLGLPLARKIIDAHGGRINITSQVGEGTTFHLFLPMGQLGPSVDKLSATSTA